MKEFIDKLIGRLEELKELHAELIKDGLEEDFHSGCEGMCVDIIEIVNELAEEYKDKSNIIDDLKIFLQKKFDYCAEQAGMNLEAECNSEIASYFRNRKELYMDRANIYGEVMREIGRLSEEYKVSEMLTGWIPLTKQLPEYGQYVLACVPPKDGINGGHSVVIMEFREDNEPLFYRFVSAWQHLPAPYTEGE